MTEAGGKRKPRLEGVFMMFCSLVILFSTPIYVWNELHRPDLENPVPIYAVAYVWSVFSLTWFWVGWKIAKK